jgi:hypothetical protein
MNTKQKPGADQATRPQGENGAKFYTPYHTTKIKRNPLYPRPAISGRQIAYLVRLINRRGQKQYLKAKHRAGLDGIRVLDLTRIQATNLIHELRRPS